MRGLRFRLGVPAGVSFVLEETPEFATVALGDAVRPPLLGGHLVEDCLQFVRGLVVHGLSILIVTSVISADNNQGMSGWFFKWSLIKQVLVSQRFFLN
jgi:hypothetical protein